MLEAIAELAVGGEALGALPKAGLVEGEAVERRRAGIRRPRLTLLSVSTNLVFFANPCPCVTIGFSQSLSGDYSSAQLSGGGGVGIYGQGANGAAGVAAGGLFPGLV